MLRRYVTLAGTLKMDSRASRIGKLILDNDLIVVITFFSYMRRDFFAIAPCVRIDVWTEAVPGIMRPGSVKETMRIEKNGNEYYRCPT